MAYTDGVGDQSPTDIVRELATWNLANTAQFLGGTWRWEQGRRAAQLVGHLKVPEALATKMIQQSGHRAIFCTQTQVHLRDEKILWQCRLKDEDDEHYHRRALSKRTAAGGQIQKWGWEGPGGT